MTCLPAVYQHGRDAGSEAWAACLVWQPRRPASCPLPNAGNTGVKDSDDCRGMSPLSLSTLFFTDYLWRDIVTETNRYAQQWLAQPPKRGHAHLSWTELTVSELRSWLGLIFAMGVVQKIGRLSDYWSTHASVQLSLAGSVSYAETSEFLLKPLKSMPTIYITILCSPISAHLYSFWLRNRPRSTCRQLAYIHWILHSVCRRNLFSKLSSLEPVEIGYVLYFCTVYTVHMTTWYYYHNILWWCSWV